MATEQKDVIKVFDTPANLAANLAENMMGYDTTNDRFAAQLPSAGGLKVVSDDSQQCLLATPQTLTGLKTITQNLIVTAAKMITLNQIGGLKFNTGDKHGFSINDTLDGGYIYKELLNVLGGVLSVHDRTLIILGNQDFLSNKDFSASSDWTVTTGFSIGAGTMNFAHSDGTDDFQQVSTDMINHLMQPNTWYKLIYDVTASNGTPTVVISTDTADAEVTVDITVATLKELYFKTNGTVNAPFKIEVTSSIAGDTFSIDNLAAIRLQGQVDASQFGPGGSVEISGRGDIKMTANQGTIDRSGYLSGPLADSVQGLQFDSPGRARFTGPLDIGGGQVSDNPGTEGWELTERFGINETLEVQTSGAVTGNMDYVLDQGPTDGIGNYLIFVNGLKDDGSLAVAFSHSVMVKSDGGTVTIMGTPTLIAEVDEFTDASVIFSIVSDNLRIQVTGSASDDINWTSQVIGHGNQLGPRTF